MQDYREGSLFTKSRMPLKKWLLLLHCWVRQYPAKDAAEEAEVDPNTACDIYRYFLEVRLKMSIILCCVYRWFRKTTLLNTTIFLGGPGKKVDESLFRRKPKVKLIILHF